MTKGIQDELQAFATTVLERRGVLVDWPADADHGSALVPADVAETLAVEGEMIRLSSQPGGKGLCVSLATDFLDVAGRLLEAEPRIGVFRVSELYLKRGKIDEAVSHAFTWLNAKVKTSEARATRIEYHTWWFHVSIVSEDHWETRLSTTINSASGVEVALPDPLHLWELEPRPQPGGQAPSTYDRAVAHARNRVKSLAVDFISRMDSRLERDRKRLREYYGALLREAKGKKPRGGVREEPKQIEAKARAVQLELRRKLGELDERYSMEVTLRPILLIRTEVPVLAIDLQVFRKQSRRKHTVFWNPLLKKVEPLCCSRCNSRTYTVAFTNEEVEPLCAACAK
jgi:hypothetical protein